MNRAGFLRSLFLAPLAALAGCKRESAPMVLRDGTLTVPATWTCDTTGTYSTVGDTVWINCGDTTGMRWVNMQTNGAGDTIYALAGNYLP